METYSDAIIARRIRWVIVGMGLLAVVLAAQLVRWQLVVRPELPPLPTPGAVSSIGLPRGHIVDRQGRLLAADAFRWEIYASPPNIRRAPPEQADRLLTELAAALHWSKDDLLGRLNTDAPSVLLTREGTLDMARVVERYDPRYVWADAIRLRYYPQDQLAAHLLGFVNESGIGYHGVEGFYNPFLGLGILPHEAQNRTSVPLSPLYRPFLPSEAGHDLILTIDQALQYVVESELRQALADYGAASGTILVMEPKTGAILAMASHPTYNPNLRRPGEQMYFADPAVAKVYEPGSVFKVITLASALDAGVITPESRVMDTGVIEIGGRRIANVNERAWGNVTVTEILARSLNVSTALIAQQMGKEAFYAAVRAFGFGSLTGVDLYGEVPGLVRFPGQAEWTLSDLAANAFGQAIAVTPLQLATAIAAIANDGQLVRPHVVAFVVADGEQIAMPTETIRQVVSPETAKTFTHILLEATESAAGGPLISGYHFAGKTGTAQIPGPGGYLEGQTITTFVGYGPVSNPRLLVLVKLDRPTTSIWGQEVALPVFRRVVERLLTMLAIPLEE